jgi:DNA-binding GntR family transcriptional regulator
VREALKRLQREGLVHHDAGRSAVVSPVSLQDVVSLFRAREASEIYSLKLAARAADKEIFREAASAFERAAGRRRPDVEEIRALSERFDLEVDRAADSPYLTGAVHDVRTHLMRLRRLVRPNPSRLRGSATQHQAIASAIVAGDMARAAQAGSERLRDDLAAIVLALADAVIGDAGQQDPDPLEMWGIHLTAGRARLSEDSPRVTAGQGCAAGPSGSEMDSPLGDSTRRPPDEPGPDQAEPAPA